MGSDHGLPFTAFSTAEVEPVERWELWRSSISVIFDVAPWDGFGHEPVHAAIRACNLGSIIVGETSFSPQHYERAPKRIARDGLDHYLVQLYADGGYAGTAGGQEVELRAGDVSILDLGQPLGTRNPASRTCSLVVPRDLFEAALPGASALHGAILRRGSGLGALLSDHIASLWRHLPELSAAEAAPVADTVVDMIAACFRPSADARSRAHAQWAAATLNTVKRHIEERLDSPELRPETIAASFRMSRATLYRLFEPIGGITTYIQSRRLARAHADLVHPAHRHRLVYDIALDWGFVSEAHFSRSFRRAFGLPPSEARALAGSTRRVAARSPGSENAHDYADWLTRLRSAG
jgi:AraC-like DNA-binding protein